MKTCFMCGQHILDDDMYYRVTLNRADGGVEEEHFAHTYCLGFLFETEEKEED